MARGVKKTDGPTGDKPDLRKARSEISKRRLIETAIDLIAEQGLAGATLQKLAERTGLSRTLAVFHFKTKENLFVELLNHLTDEYDRLMRTTLHDDLAPAEKLRALVEFDLSFGITHPKYLSVWYAFWGEARGSAIYQEVTRPLDHAYRAESRDIIQQVIDAQKAGDLDAETIADGLGSMVLGIWLDAHLEPGSFDVERARRAIYSYLSRIFPDHFAA